MPASPVWDFGGSRFLRYQQQCVPVNQEEQQQQQEQEQEQQQGYYSLGCIFENPIAFEDSRRKIDYCNDRSEEVTHIARRKMEALEQRQKLLDSSNRKQLAGDLNCPKRTGKLHAATRRSCRRKLCLDDIPIQQNRGPDEFAAARKNNAGGKQSRRSRDPTAQGINNELSSSPSSSCPEDLLELKLERAAEKHDQREAGSCTPVADVIGSPIYSPVPSGYRSASLRSLEGLEMQTKDRIDDLQLEPLDDWTRSDSSSSESSANQSRANEFCVYPGWSMWSGSNRQQHSYRSISESPLHNSCTPSLRRLGVKSLHQHLLSAARQQHSVGRVTSLKSPSGKATVRSRSPRVGSLNRAGSRTKALQQNNVVSAKSEEAKLPLLKSQRKHGRKKSWEPVAFFTRGLKSVISKGISPPACDFPSVINIPKKLVQQQRPQQLTKPEQMEVSVSSRTTSEGGVTEPLLQEGYLQCLFKQGVTSYSFWKDNFDEVIVAKAQECVNTGDRCFTFYTCRRKNRGRLKQLQKPIVNRVGTMNLSSTIRTEADSRGEIVHFMDSEFSLMDERIHKPVNSTSKDNAGNRSRAVVAVSSYFKAFWNNALMKNGSEAAGTISYEELAAMIIRVPLKVKKEWRSVETAGPKKPLGRLLRAKQSERKCISQASWNSFVGSASETISLVLPAGDHGHPTCGLDGPRPLIERWRSGGLCDCGSWDLGCGIVVLSKQYSISRQGDNQPLSILVEGRKDKGIAMSLEQCQDGLFKLSYRQPLVSLQAFATAVAILHSKSDITDYRDYWSQEWQTKLPVVKESLRRSRGRCHPNPPMSPIDRL